MWGLLNETGPGNVFRQAVASLPLVRRLDDSRVVLLGSGRFDAIGNYLNGLEVWKPETGVAPCLTYNPKSYAMCAVTLLPAEEIALIPGVNGEYSAVRGPRRPTATTRSPRSSAAPARSRPPAFTFSRPASRCTAASST